MTRWQGILSIARQHPLAFGVVVSTLKTSFSDLLVQKVVERREEVDWKRNAAFATFGCFYLGGVQYLIYVPVFGRLFPSAAAFAAKSVKEKMRDLKGMLSLCGQVFLDQCVHHPLLYFPVFYMTKEVVMSEHPDLKRCLSEYKGNLTEDLTALWKVWVPATILNFAFMPMWARIPWTAGTSLLWTAILSAMRGGSLSDAEDLLGGEVTAASMSVLKHSIDDFFASPVDLDPHASHICVSANGPDKPGWVAIIAREVATNHGNVTHSKMVRLGSEFIVLMHVSVAPHHKRQLVSSILNNPHLKPMNLRVSSLTRRQTGRYVKPVLGFRVHCVGPDRPGVLAAVAEKISSEGLSVDNIVTELRAGKAGVQNFVINCDCVTGDLLDREEEQKLVARLLTLKHTLQLDHMDVRIHQV